MQTEVLSITSSEGYRRSTDRAAQVLREGGLVAFPTETVYGLGVSAVLPDAVERLRQVKGRSASAPFTVHIGRREQALSFLGDVSPMAYRLMEAAWPGPLTIVFEVDDPLQTEVGKEKGAAFVEQVYTEGSIGIRFPACEATCDLINALGDVVLASSANRSGDPPPINASQVLAALDGDVDVLLDGGPTQYGQASSVVRVNRQGWTLLREGVLQARTISRLAMTNILLVCTGNTCRSPMAEGLLKHLLAQKLECSVEDLPSRGYRVFSAGTSGFDGSPATPEAVDALKERGIDLSDHRSSSLTREMIEQAQHVWTMTEMHRAAVVQMAPHCEKAVQVMGGEESIEDPIGGSLELYRNVSGSD